MQKNSTYNKIREIINAASQEKIGIDKLAQLLHDNPNSFLYYRRDPNSDTVREYPCSRQTIKEKIRFCIEMGLIKNEDDCTPTASGENALEIDRFDLVLQQAILEYLEKNDLPWSKIESTIKNLSLPSPHKIYVEISPSLPEDRFRTCLFLLSQCGEDSDQNVLYSQVMKIYTT